MDGIALPRYPRTHLHRHLRLLVGLDSLAPICRIQFRLLGPSPRIARHW